MNIVADIDLIGTSSISIKATADIDSSGDFVLYATASVNFKPSFGIISLDVSPTVMINTGGSEVSVDGQDIDGDTYEVELQGSLSFFGLSASGTIIAGVVGGNFELEIPSSDPLTVSFFGLGTLSIYGTINNDGQFNIDGSISVNLSEAGVGELYGSLSVDISNNGFYGAFWAGPTSMSWAPRSTSPRPPVRSRSRIRNSTSRRP